MTEKRNSGEMPYQHREDTDPHKQTGNINSRNNNINNESPATSEPNVENANNTGIGDTGLNDEKLSNYTQNHSSDA